MPTAAPGAAPLIVGLRWEREVLTVALAAGRHMVIEGPPGTGKSTLLRDIARLAGIDRLHVMCPRPAVEARKAAEALARSGGGLSQPLRRVADVPAALTRALA